MVEFLGKKIPPDMLAQLPNGFVLRLRDIRYKRMVEEKKRNDAFVQSQQQKTNQMQQHMNQPGSYGINESALEEVLDELS